MNINKFKSFARRAFALLLVLFCLCSMFACKSKNEDNGKSRILAYDGVSVEEYVRIGEYKGLTVTVLEGQTKAEAVWNAVTSDCEVLGYPEEQVDYYYSQSKKRCEYYATVNGVSYEEALAALHTDEETMLNEARELVAQDLIELALRKSAGITLTDEEKEKYFDKYAEKYADDWGYNLTYVENELSDEVYASMLYDKTTEYLLKNNTFAEQ